MLATRSAREAARHVRRPVGTLAALAMVMAVTTTPARADDRAITDALIWVGASERVARRSLDRRDAPAIRSVERRLGTRRDDRLDAGEQRAVLAAARHAREREGYQTIIDPATGARVGLPTAWLGPRRNTGGGSAWVSPDGAIAVQTFGVEGLDAFERGERARPGVRVTYAAGGGRWRVVSGYEPGGRTFYARAETRGGRTTAFRASYETALGERLDRVVVAMSSDFQPGGTPAALAYAPLTERDDRFDPLMEPAAPRFTVLPEAGPAPRERPVVASLDRTLDVPDTRAPAAVPTEPVAPAAPLAPAAPSRGGPLSLDDPALDLDTDLSLDPAREAPSGGALDTGEAERQVPETITGLVTDEGQSCPTLRAADGTLYALVGEVPALVPGTLVTIEAVGVDTERCSAGRTVAVGGLSVQSSPR